MFLSPEEEKGKHVAGDIEKRTNMDYALRI
jgi:hypothetical protein